MAHAFARVTTGGSGRQQTATADAPRKRTTSVGLSEALGLSGEGACGVSRRKAAETMIAHRGFR
jgi:hypothetical protein